MEAHMSDAIVIKNIEIISVAVTHKTNWLFLRMTSFDGVEGLGEASLSGREGEVIDIFAVEKENIIGRPVDLESLERKLQFDSLPRAAYSSAIMQCFSDIVARSQGISLAESLGGIKRSFVGMYANINRRTIDRLPAGFAESALLAQRNGFTAFKLAPFDEVLPNQSQREIREAMTIGFDRIQAVVDAVDSGSRVMVDCHWRFNFKGAEDLINALVPFNLYWIECPIVEELTSIPDLVSLRHQANKSGVRLAGLEMNIRTSGFQPYLDGGAYDVMMPDIKYAGGPDELLRIAEVLESFGVDFSPHNPTGPICHAASIQVCAAATKIDLLEHQFDETIYFDELVSGELPTVSEGGVVIKSSATGIGVTLNGEVLQALTIL
ncbi:MAG TPA: mandelate racemase/muconate lactonizing enzyme family protein [Dehalococcoidia bacterium]|jgi:galactonate dehydratase|nr:mandelate racemase/muconate lactonizing enzyme family protein [Dehalococcoidia bacterium]